MSLQRDANRFFDTYGDVYSDWAQRKGVYEDVSRVIASVARKTGLNIFEVGCGGGGFLRYCQERLEISDSVGLDLSSGLLRSAKVSGTNVMRGSALALPIRSESFECTIAVSVMHHLVGPNLQASFNNCLKALHEMTRITKKDGLIIVKEGIGVRHEWTRILIYFISKLFSKTGFAPLKLMRGEILAILTPRSMSELTTRMTHSEMLQVLNSSLLDRPSTDFRPLNFAWRRLNCGLLTVYQKVQ